MGKVISKVYGTAMREVKSFNIERRAEKVISKEKPDRAPMYASTIKELEQLEKDNVSTEYITKKDENLDKYLKQVYVTSPDNPPPLKRLENPERALPQNRSMDDGFSPGFSDTDELKIPAGRISLKQALQFLSDHYHDPKTYSNQAIASQYKLDINTTNDILEHFKIFNVHLQKKDKKPEDLTEYQKIQEKIQTLTMYNASEVSSEVNAFVEKQSKEKDRDSVEETESSSVKR